MLFCLQIRIIICVLDVLVGFETQQHFLNKNTEKNPPFVQNSMEKNMMLENSFLEKLNLTRKMMSLQFVMLLFSHELMFVFSPVCHIEVNTFTACFYAKPVVNFC